MLNARELFVRRKQRNRFRLRKRAKDRPRLSVFRSNKHIYAQVIDDLNRVTLASASTKDKEITGGLKTGGDADAATAVGKLLAERAKKAGVGQVIFDRGGYSFHGRIKALAEAAREAGL